MQITWVWYSFLYWISPTFSNHLKFRWHHYKFCKGRAEVFRVQLYLGEWKLEIERIIAKNPRAIIPSHGHFAILEMIKHQKIEKIVTFLESNNIEESLEVFIGELNKLKNTNLDYLETLPLPNTNDFNRSKINESNTPQSNEDENSSLKEKLESENDNVSLNSDQINVRTYVIATQIYYEIFLNSEDLYEMKKYTNEYVKTIKRLFPVRDLPDHNMSRLKNFDYTRTLKGKTGSSKGQLRRQLEQIVNNPSMFGEEIAKYAEYLIKKYLH